MTECKHPEDKRTSYHDMSVRCTACDCIVEQFGKAIEPPEPLSMAHKESSFEPTCLKAETTQIQRKKIDYLLNKGGKFSGDAMYYIKMPDGSVAKIDPFGRVTW